LFSQILNVIWPIEKDEIKIFLPMALMMLCVLFNFGALRSIKDGLVVPSIGAEVISFLKLWLVLPSSIIFAVIYAKLSNILEFEKIFIIILAFFLGFFLIFAYVIYPNQEFYHPSAETVEHYATIYPHFQWFIKIAGKWSYALMYIYSELWSAVVINLMFWQFANHIFDTKKAKRFYPILAMVGNTGLILAGNMLVIFSDIAGSGSGNEVISDQEFHKNCQIMLKPIITIIAISGIIAIALFKFINSVVLKDQRLMVHFERAKEETKTKLSLIGSIKLITKSKYIGHIVLLILCYGLLINILEGPWKSKVKELYPNTIEYVKFMGRFNIWMGISCVFFTILGSNILRRRGWFISALLTPIMFFFTGSIFFIFVIFGHNVDLWGSWIDPIYAAVLAGAIQNILSKSTKYSLFDATKEMAYIPLAVELRTKGKAAVEVIGTKFGKGLGAFVQSAIFTIAPAATFDSIVAYLSIIFIAIIMLWFWNVAKLHEEYLKLTAGDN
jgi:ADP/ATP carrier protein family